MFLDDLRNPVTDCWAWDDEHTSCWVIARSSEEAKSLTKAHGCPSFIAFDHDLGGDDTSMDYVHWLIDHDINMNGTLIPKDFDYLIHSANPIGKENINSLLTSYLTFREQHFSSALRFPLFVQQYDYRDWNDLDHWDDEQSS
jgi:hypothetical protein